MDRESKLTNGFLKIQQISTPQLDKQRENKVFLPVSEFILSMVTSYKNDGLSNTDMFCLSNVPMSGYTPPITQI